MDKQGGRCPITKEELEAYKNKAKIGDAVKIITQVEEAGKPVLRERKFFIVKKFPYIAIVKNEKGTETSFTWQELLSSNRLVKRPSVKKWGEEEIVELYQAGKSRLEIAKMLGCNYEYITSSIAKRRNFHEEKQAEKELLKKEIFKLRKTGKTIRQISQLIGVSASKVQRFTAEFDRKKK